MGQEAESGTTIQALERAVQIVRTLQEHESLTLTELSELLDLPTSTAHVYLKTLEQEGFVVREDSHYRNGLKFLEYGGHARQHYGLFSAARQVMIELALRTGERVGLGVEENGQRVLIGIEDGMDAVSDNVPIGEFTEMHWTGLGKCLLAHLPPHRRDRIIERSDLPRATDNTITDPDALRAELAAIREQGYAVEDEERREGIRGVDVPILTPDDEIIGAVGLSGPVDRFDATQLSKYATLLQNKANVIKLKTVYY
jgi:DNA-binding IclR family transcriptional regulator